MSLDILDYIRENPNISPCKGVITLNSSAGYCFKSLDHPDKVFSEDMKIIPLSLGIGLKGYSEIAGEDEYKEFYALPIDKYEVTLLNSDKSENFTHLSINKDKLDESITVSSDDEQDATHLMLMYEPSMGKIQCLTLPIDDVLLLDDPMLHNDITAELSYEEINPARKMLDPYDGIDLEVLEDGHTPKIYYKETSTGIVYSISVSYVETNTEPSLYITYIHKLKMIIPIDSSYLDCL